MLTVAANLDDSATLLDRTCLTACFSLTGDADELKRLLLPDLLKETAGAVVRQADHVCDALLLQLVDNQRRLHGRPQIKMARLETP